MNIENSYIECVFVCVGIAVRVLDSWCAGTLELLLFIHKFLYDAGGDDDDVYEIYVCILWQILSTVND